MRLPAILDSVMEAPLWQRALLGLMGLVILVAGAYFLVLSPRESRIALLTAQHESLQREIVQARAAVADLARIRREAALLEQRLETMKERLPTEREMPALYRTLTDTAYQSGLAVSLFRPREPKILDFYTEIPISLTAEGGYHQVGAFFERIARLPRVVKAAEAKLSGLSRATDPLRAEITLTTYTYRAPGSPPAPKPPGAPR